jgi:D-alanyl-D-alanine carboxypeptidase-like protein
MAQTPQNKDPVYDDDHEYPLVRGEENPASSQTIEDLQRQEGIQPRVSIGGRPASGSSTAGGGSGSGSDTPDGVGSSDSTASGGGGSSNSTNAGNGGSTSSTGDTPSATSDLADRETNPGGLYSAGVAGVATGGINPRNIKQFFWGNTKRRRRTVAGGLTGLLLGGGLFGLTILSGPGQLIQLSHVLQRNFDNSQNASSSRANQLLRYSAAQDIGETRVGLLGRQYLRSTLSDLSDIGITFQTNSTGGLAGATVDAEKLASQYPELEGMTNDERQAWLADKFSLSTDAISLQSDGTFNIDATDFPFKSLSALVSNSLSLLGNGRIISTIQDHYLTTYLDLPSLLHPIERAKAAALRKATTLAERQASVEDDEQNEIAGVEADAAPEVADVENENNTFSSGAMKFLLFTGGACLVRGVSGEISKINEDRVVLPSVIEAMNFTAVGEQIESGQDLTADQAGALEESLTNAQGQNIWQGTAMQATEGDSTPSGTDLPEQYQQAFNENTGGPNGQQSTAETLSSWADDALGGSTLASITCSPVGIFVQAGLALAATLGGSLADAISGGTLTPELVAAMAAKEGASFAVSGLAMNFIQNFILSKTTSGKLAKDAFSGPVGGDLLAYGAREAANIGARASGGIQLAGSVASALTYQQEKQNEEQFRSESFFARVFNIDDQRTLLGKLADSLSPNLIKNVSAGISSAGGLGHDLITDLSSIFMPRSQAATTSSYNWGFPEYGIPPSILNNPAYANPYDNANQVAALLSGSNGQAYITKAQACFGVNISNTNSDNVWDVIPQGDVDPNSSSYVDANCSDTSDPNWQRVMLFVLDTRTMQAIACYQGDETSCSDNGYNDTGSASTGATPSSASTTSTAGATLDTADLDTDSTSVACAPNTRNIGIYQGYTGGNEVDVRLCAIPNLPSTGEESNDGYGVTGGDGQCVLNSRVSGAVYAMVQAADKAGVSLAATSCFRTMAHQQALFAQDGGDTDLAAVPGTSNHQMGLAIDFQTLTQSPGPDTGNPVWDWLAANAANFGYHNSTVVEAWHWSPSGN